MRLLDINLKLDDLVVNGEVENKSFIIVYSSGTAKLTYLPDHGETKVITHQGKVKRVRFDQGEEF